MTPEEYLNQGNPLLVEEFVQSTYTKMKQQHNPVLPYVITGDNKVLNNYYEKCKLRFAKDGWFLKFTNEEERGQYWKRYILNVC